jgi:hypothetical protein
MLPSTPMFANTTEAFAVGATKAVGYSPNKTTLPLSFRSIKETTLYKR